RILAVFGGHLRLRALWLPNNHLGPAGAEALAGAAGLDSLTTLGLTYNVLEEAGHAALAASSRLARLTRLHLRNAGTRAGDTQAWCSAACLPGLVELDLGNNISLGDPAALLSSARRLRSLTLDQNRDGPAVARALSEARHLTDLVSLRLGSTNLDDEAVR